MMKKAFIQTFTVMILLLSLFSFSYGLDGEGEGGGANSDEPLVLVSSNLEQNQKDVPVDIKVHMEFNKNIVNMTVAEKNRGCITLSDQNGNPVPIKVLMGDDQVDPTIKRIIDVAPDDVLHSGERYTLTIGSGFQAKNGTSLKAPISIAFQTEGSKQLTTPSEGENLKQEASLSDQNNDPQNLTGASIADDQQSQGQPQNGTERKINKNIVRYLSIGCIAVAVILLAIFIRRRIK